VTPLRNTVALMLLPPLALAASAASASPAEAPLVSVSATPAQIVIAGQGSRTIALTNRGAARIAVDVAAADFAFDAFGRTTIGRVAASRRSARTWLTVSPRRRVIRAGRTTLVHVTARTPRGAEPGDHHALVLLATRPVRRGVVALRTRVGVLVLVRVRGRIVRRLDVLGLRVRRHGRARLLELHIVNRGNVTERLVRRCVTMSLVSRGRVRTRLVAPPRDLLPRTSGRVVVTYVGRLRGPARVVVRVRPLPAALDGPGAPELRPFSRAFRVGL
jgi:hypothetical protein